MSHDKGTLPLRKVSRPFQERLDALEDSHRIRAILLLYASKAPSGRGERQTPAQRESTIEAIREVATASLPAIDGILASFGGRRLTEGPDALGSVLVETTPACVRALAASEHVKAILEDQPISLLRPP